MRVLSQINVLRTAEKIFHNPIDYDFDYWLEWIEYNRRFGSKRAFDYPWNKKKVPRLPKV